MHTAIKPADKAGIEEAARLIRNGMPVGMPTETVYGLAANAFDTPAVERIFQAKGRPQDNPLIVHIADFSMLGDLVKDVSPIAQKLAKSFWPGPLTIVMPKSDKVPLAVTAGLDTVAVRMPKHNAALELIHAAGVPLAAPSANLSGSPSPTTAMHVFDDLNGRIPLILDGGSCEVGLESTVVLLQGDKIRVLRPGSITPEQLSNIGEVTIDRSVLQSIVSDKPLSPGTKYRHYSPKARVVIVKGSHDGFARYFEQVRGQGDYALAFDPEGADSHMIAYGKTPKEQAKRLFAVLRNLDEIGAKTVYVHAPEPEGIGLAVYNRLLRAAAFNVVEV